MFIQTESTPNPATLKFLPGQQVLEAGTADFPAADTAGNSPLANRIFGVTYLLSAFRTLFGRYVCYKRLRYYYYIS